MRADEADEARLVQIASALADAVEEALPSWVRRSVHRRAGAEARRADPTIDDRAAAAGERCRAEVAPAVRELLLTDLDEQRATPLALLRSATRYPTEVLAAAGVAPVDRDEFARRAFPGDVYALAPASFGDLDADDDGPVGELGLMWGAAKAHVHLARRRAEGRR